MSDVPAETVRFIIDGWREAHDRAVVERLGAIARAERAESRVKELSEALRCAAAAIDGVDQPPCWCEPMHDSERPDCPVTLLYEALAQCRSVLADEREAGRG